MGGWGVGMVGGRMVVCLRARLIVRLLACLSQGVLDRQLADSFKASW